MGKTEETRCPRCGARTYNKNAQVCFACGYSAKGFYSPHRSKSGEIIKMKSRDEDTRIAEGFRLIEGEPYEEELDGND